MTCDFCTGSHYLSDDASLGPCVCVTPEALRAAEAQLGRLRGLVVAAHEAMYGGLQVKPRSGSPWARLVEAVLA